MELRHVWQIIWKRRWLIIQSFVVVTLVAVVGSEFVPEAYMARAKIWIPQETGQSTLLSLFGLRALSSTYPGGRTPLKEEMKNRTLLATLLPVYEDVIWNLQLRTAKGDLITARSLRGMGPSYIFSPRPIVSVKATREASFLTVTGLSMDPEEAQMLANAMAYSYMKNDERMLKNETRVGQAFVEEQMAEVSKMYDRALDEFQAFQEREGTVNLPLETQISIRRVADLITERERLMLSANETEARLIKAQQQLDDQTLALWTEASGTTSGDPELSRLTQDWTRSKIRLRNTLIEKTENHPLVDVQKKEVENIESELRERLELYESFSPLVIRSKRDLIAFQAQLEGLDNDIEARMEELGGIPGKTLEQARLQLKIDALQEVYSSLLEYDKTLGLAEAISLEDVKVVEEAPLPTAPSLPNKARNRSLGMVFGLIMGLALAFLVEHLDDRFIVPDDVVSQEPLPLLGVIPFVRGRQVRPGDASGRAFEPYRFVRHNLKGILGGRPPRSLSILSPASGEGRSLIAANTALSFCREGRSVVLLDADLRNPSQHKIFGTERSPGVEEILAGTASIESALKDTGIDGLKLLPAGAPSADPAKMVESRGMPQLIEELEKRFDMVVADTPPLLAFTDGVIIAGMMETSVIVYESRRTTVKMAEAAKHSLERARAVPAGVILNKVKVERFAFKSYGYEEV